ncbi:MAG: transporter substrate-binding domain-containing protein [Actinomycetota bacterium]
MRKSRFLMLFVMVLALTAAACSKSTTPSPAADGGTEPAGNDLLAKIKADGVIRVSTDPAYPPQSELNPKTGEYEGFDIDVAEEIARRLGVTVEWETPSWDLITAGGWNDRWDMSVGSMTVTPERAEVVDFTPGYYYTPAVAMVNEANTTILDPAADLDGKKVGVCGGCTYDFYLQKTLEIPGETIDFQVDDAQIKTYDTDSTAIQDLTLGDGDRLDAVITAGPTAEGAVDKGKPVKIVGEPLFYEPLAVAFDRKSELDGASLVAAVSDIITEMHADGTLTELSNQWFGQDLTTRVTS